MYNYADFKAAEYPPLSSLKNTHEGFRCESFIVANLLKFVLYLKMLVAFTAIFSFTKRKLSSLYAL